MTHSLIKYFLFYRILNKILKLHQFRRMNCKVMLFIGMTAFGIYAVFFIILRILLIVKDASAEGLSVGST